MNVALEGGIRGFHDNEIFETGGDGEFSCSIARYFRGLCFCACLKKGCGMRLSDDFEMLPRFFGHGHFGGGNLGIAAEKKID